MNRNLSCFKYGENLKNSEMENDKTVPKATIVAISRTADRPGTPIQFDIVLPATEFLDQNRGSRLIDPQTQVTRANFELASVTQFVAHQDNKRLVGFVVRDAES
ncbi:DCC-interacting protein 13-beta, partial [Manis javanica]